MVLVEILRSQMLGNVGEVAHFKDLIEGNHILQFYLIEGGTLILEGWLNFTLDFVTEDL
jgi:hypothetical protein